MSISLPLLRSRLAPRRSRVARSPLSPVGLGLLCGCVAALTATPADAAPIQPGQDPDGRSSVWRESTGIHEDGAGLRGSGPDYKVSFEPGIVFFTPALGRSAPHNLPLGFELESIRRGGELVHGVDRPVTPQRASGAVLYQHGAGIVERYEVRPQGLEQSFVFSAPLAGQGELVVRGRILTELPWPELGESRELEFRLPAVGGAHVGAVSGVDAEGTTASGALRFDGTFLELVLPAEFVAAAAYPLVLDPLICTRIDVATGAQKDILPDVAYDATNDIYLVVWQREFSASDTDIRGQRVLSTGALDGGQVPIEDSGALEGRYPTVASVNINDRFLVAWQQRDMLGAPYDIVGRAIPATSFGSSSVIVTIAAEAADERHPDAAGEPSLLDNDALVVWFEEGGGVRAAQVTVPAGGDPSAFGHFDLSSDSDDEYPAISRTTDESGLHLVVWQRLVHSPPPVSNDLHAALIDRNGNIQLADLWVAAGVGQDEANPDVDGDGEGWIVAYEWSSSLGGTHRDIMARPIENTGTSLILGPERWLATDPLGTEINPSVAHAGAKTFVAWSENTFGFQPDIRVLGLDPKTCGTCEGSSTMAGSGLAEDSSAMASELSGSTTAGDGALLVWQTFDGVAGGGDVEGQRLEAIGAGGSTVNLGGGCGGGGTFTTHGAIAPGNAAFSASIHGADPGATVALFLVKAPGPLAIGACGPCSYLNWPWSVLAAPVSSGVAKLPLPIPCRSNINGKTVLAQWFVWPTTQSPCKTLANISMSDVLEVTFQH